jgi:cell division septation protein DedD
VIITPVFSEQDIFYRVRVGPELDKKRAEVMKAKISELNNINGMLAIADK